MKTRFLLLCLSFCLAALPRSQAQDAPTPAPVRSQEELDQLFGPIALYPDALIALILPASTVPSDVVMAARYLRSNGDTTRVEGESWDDSVKSLSHYPEVVKWMDENLAWTKQAGEAFAAQPADVMNAIQRLRVAARAAGTLVDTPQQTVVMEGDNIEIVPADPDVIYVPRYDPEVVYFARPGYYHDPYLSFGIGFSTGIWMGYDCDWGRRRLWTIDRRDRERYWRERREHAWHDHDWRGSPRVVPGPSHPRIVEDNHFRREEWRPRPDFHRPTHVSGVVPRPDAGRPGNAPRRDSDPRNGDNHRDGDHRNDGDHRDNDHRWQRGPDRDGAKGDGRGRPNNAPSSAAANNEVVPSGPQLARTPPVASTPLGNPSVTPQPAQPTPRPDHGRHDRVEREARENSRPIPTGQNPQGRVMPLQPSVQPRQPPPSVPTVVNREARAPQSPPTAREYVPAPAREQTRSQPQPAAVQSQPRVMQSPPPSRQDNNNNSSNNRNDRDNRQDRWPRS